MQCETARPLLYRWIEERLLTDDARQVGLHVESCPACAGRLARIRDLDDAFMDIEEEKPSDRLRARILEAYRIKAAPPHTLRSTLFPLSHGLRLAAVVGLVALGSSAATFLAVKSREPAKAASMYPMRARVPMESILPLVMSDSYTVHDASGHIKHGSNIHFVR